MELVSMKIKKEKTAKRDEAEKQPALVESQDDYPYGLRLRLETDQINKMKGVEQLDTKEKVKIVATGRIIEKRVTSRTNNKDQKSIEIQIEEIGIVKGSAKSEDGESTADFIKGRNKERGIR